MTFSLCALPLLAALQGPASPEDLQALRDAFEASVHAVTSDGDSYRARNPRGRWVVEFDGRGARIEPDAGDWSWGLELVGYGWSETAPVHPRPCAVEVDGQRVEYAWDDRLTEWFVNDRRGLEHGFTLLERPRDAAGNLTVRLRVRGALVPSVSTDGLDVHFEDAAHARILDYAGLEVFDALGSNLEAGWEVREHELVLVVRDADACYPLTIDPIAQEAYLKASNVDADDFFGVRLAVDGDTAVVGAHAEDSAATGVNGNQSSESADSSGAAYVFVRNGTTWVQQAYLKASNTGIGDEFGRFVALSGDTIAVTAALEDSAATGVNGDQNDNSASNAGAVYVFVRNGTTWTQEAYIKASNTDANDEFGSDVDLDGDTLVVGAFREDSASGGVNGDESDDSLPQAGAAYVFVRNAGVWSQQAYLKASSPLLDDRFGYQVAMDGDTVVVASPEADAAVVDCGAVDVFVRQGGSWSHQARLTAPNAGTDDSFGWPDLHGDRLIVGAPGEDSDANGVNGDGSNDNKPDSGAAYIFVRNGGTWTHEAYLKAAVSDAIDAFGGIPTLRGTRAVIGAAGEDSGSHGFDGDPGDNSMPFSGAAYVFERTGTTWAQTHYFKPSNTKNGQAFGYGIDMTDEFVLIGAHLESGGSPGINGDQTAGLQPFSGAAYAFDLEAPFTPYCAQSKATSKSYCWPSLTAWDPTLATGTWDTTSIPRAAGLGVGNVVGIYIFTHGVGIGPSTFSLDIPFGTLCLSGFKRSAPACAPAVLVGANAGACNTGTLSTALNCNGGALGIAVGDDVNVQLWYRDPGSAGDAGFSNAIFYTVQ